MQPTIACEIRRTDKLTPTDLTAIECLIQAAGFRFAEGYLDAVHFRHKPFVVLAREVMISGVGNSAVTGR